MVMEAKLGSVVPPLASQHLARVVRAKHAVVKGSGLGLNIYNKNLTSKKNLKYAE